MAEVHHSNRLKILSYCYYVCHVTSSVSSHTEISSLSTERHEANCFGVQDECQQVTQTWHLPSRAPGMDREKTLDRNLPKYLYSLRMSSDAHWCQPSSGH